MTCFDVISITERRRKVKSTNVCSTIEKSYWNIKWSDEKEQIFGRAIEGDETTIVISLNGYCMKRNDGKKESRARLFAQGNVDFAEVGPKITISQAII